jgi:hypothetical protein
MHGIPFIFESKAKAAQILFAKTLARIPCYLPDIEEVTYSRLTKLYNSGHVVHMLRSPKYHWVPSKVQVLHE